MGKVSFSSSRRGGGDVHKLCLFSVSKAAYHVAALLYWVRNAAVLALAKIKIELENEIQQKEKRERHVLGWDRAKAFPSRDGIET